MLLRDEPIATVSATPDRAVAPAEPMARSPAQLPAPAAGFVGRADTLASLDHLVDHGDPNRSTVIVLAGTAGVGKTTVALYWARQRADRFPDGQLFADLHGFDPSGAAIQPDAVLRQFLQALDVPVERFPPDLDALASLYRSTLAGRRILVVLDNARDAAQVRPLLPGEPQCAALITSRQHLTGVVISEGARPVTVDLFTTAEANQLLARRVGAARVAAEPVAVGQLIDHTGRLPLALAIVAARAATLPERRLAVLVDELLANRGMLDGFTDDDPATNIRAVFAGSYRALSADAAPLFRMVGLHPSTGFTAAAAASLAALPVDGADALLAELVRANLLIEQDIGRYSMHDLLHAFAAELTSELDRPDDRRAAQVRMSDHYLHTAVAAAIALTPHRQQIDVAPPQDGVVWTDFAEPEDATVWLTRELPAMLALIARDEPEFDRYTWQLAWAITDFLDRSGRWPDWVASHQLALRATRRLVDPAAEGRMLRSIGRAYTKLGQHDDARGCLRQAADLCAETGDRVAQAFTYSMLASIDEGQGRFVDALDHYHQALELFQRFGDRHVQATTLDRLGDCHHDAGDHGAAQDRWQQALDILIDLDHADAAAIRTKLIHAAPGG